MPVKRSYFSAEGDLTEAQAKRLLRDIKFKNSATPVSVQPGKTTDPFSVCDPWWQPQSTTKKFVHTDSEDPWRNYLRIVPPPDDSKTSTPSVASQCPPTLRGVSSGVVNEVGSSKYMGALETLVACQNNTIAVLAGQLDWVAWYISPSACASGQNSSDDVAKLEARIKKAEEQIAKLSCMLDKLTTSLDSMQSLTKDDNRSLLEDVRQLIDSANVDCHSLVHSSIEKTFDTTCEVIKKTRADFDAKLLALEARLHCNLNDDVRLTVEHPPMSATSGAKVSDAREDLTTEAAVKVASASPTMSGTHQFDNSDSKLHDFGIGDYVRLCNLKAKELNGKPGVITDFIRSSGRVAVRLHGALQSKAYLPQNLTPYECASGDICDKCNDRLNLNAFPACSCLTRMQSNDKPTKESEFHGTTEDVQALISSVDWQS